MMAGTLFETGILLVATFVAVLASAPAGLSIGLMVVLALLALFPARRLPILGSDLRSDRAAALASLVLLGMAAPVPEGAGWTWIGLGFLAAGLGLLGCMTAFKNRPAWRAQGRGTMVLAVLVALFAISMVAAEARAPFWLGADARVIPGRLGFVPSLWLWSGIAFGLEGYLRTVKPSNSRGWASLWDKRQVLLAAAAAAVVLLRTI